MARAFSPVPVSCIIGRFSASYFVYCGRIVGSIMFSDGSLLKNGLHRS